MLERGWSEILKSIDFRSCDFMVPVLPAGLRVTTELKPPASKSPEDSTLMRRGRWHLRDPWGNREESVFSWEIPGDFPLFEFVGLLGRSGPGGFGGVDIQLELVRRPWLGPPGVHPCLEAGPNFPDPLAVPVVSWPLWATGFWGGTPAKEEPDGSCRVVVTGSCWHPSHPAPPRTDRTHEALTKGDSTSFGPNPEICFPGPLFIEAPSPYWGWSVIHTLSGVYNSFIKFRAGRGFNSE